MSNDSVDTTLVASSNSSSDGNTIYVSDDECSEHSVPSEAEMYYRPEQVPDVDNIPRQSQLFQPRVRPHISLAAPAFNYREPIRYTSDSSTNESEQNDRSSGIDTEVSSNYEADNDDISNDDNFNTDDNDDIDEDDDIAYMSEDMSTNDYADDLDIPTN
ncbi:hypothetical protein LPJ73_001552 [Coemansia sp. RSA 2703]|nr:hypothetical protein LPJ73_001552 [Coemansia sp. RSA 2703]